MPTIFRSRPRVGRTIKPDVDRRSSPRERGYDARWDRRAKEYRRRHPFCARCEEIDRQEFAAVVDHKYPVQDGGLVHCDDAGLWSLCVACHGWKARLEAFARTTGQLDRIVEWCDLPEVRPQLRGDVRDGPSAS